MVEKNSKPAMPKIDKVQPVPAPTQPAKERKVREKKAAFAMPSPTPTMEQAYATMMEAKGGVETAKVLAQNAVEEIKNAKANIIAARGAKKALKAAEVAHAYTKKVYVRVM